MVSVEKTDAAELEDAANLRATARRLGQACAAERVILFGSRATGRKEAVPRHNEIKRHLARSICRNLSVEVPKGA